MRRWICLIALLSLACSERKLNPRTGERLSTRPDPEHAVDAELRERRGTGSVRYLGFDVQPRRLRPGEAAVFSHYFEVLKPLSRSYTLSVEGRTAAGPALRADHPPLGGAQSTSEWSAGEFYKDIHTVLVPSTVDDDLVVYVGLYADGQRTTVIAAPGASDGQDRVRAGRIEVQSGAKGLETATVPRTSGEIRPDGRLDEAAWAKAPTLSFSDSMGGTEDPRFPTKLRLLWDETNLYVGFESRDEDITCPFGKRDDPIYDHEAVELFLMPHVQAPEVGPYIELQASPAGIIFDASFTGRRRGMDRSFNGGQTVGTQVNGSLNSPGADQGWVSEWVVPWTSLKWVKSPPRVGDEWRMNAFRIEKFREGGRLQGEYTAWSPPRVGDFHNTARFGRLRFGR